MSWVLVALGACTNDTTAASAGDSSEVVGYHPDLDDGGGTSLEASALEDQLQAVLDVVVDLHAKPIITGFLEVYGARDDACPTVQSFGTSTVYNGSCTTTSGATWDGQGTYYEFSEMLLTGSSHLYTGQEIFASTEVVTADGETWKGIGKAKSWHGVPNDEDTDPRWFSWVEGDFLWEGDPDTWVSQGLSLDLKLTLTRVADSGDQSVELKGAVGGVGDAGESVYFDELRLFAQALGSDCEQEPEGIVSVRAADGGWYELSFDGDSDPNDDMVEGTCDGCGAASYRGEALGEVCVDWSVLYAWGEAPW